MTKNLENLDIKINIEETGTGKPLILLHGWGLDSNIWTPIIPQLAKSFKVYLVDLPGFGKSGTQKSAWGTEEYAYSIKEIFKRLKLKKAFLLGHSFGGNVSWVFASNYPELVEKLVLVDSSGFRDKDSKIKFFWVAAKIGKTLTSLPLLDKFQLKSGESLYKIIGAHDYEQSGSLKETFKRVVSEKKTGLLKKIMSPTLIIWGGQDQETPTSNAYLFRSSIPNSQLVTVPESGHFPFLDRPTEFTRVIINFLKHD